MSKMTDIRIDRSEYDIGWRYMHHIKWEVGEWEWVPLADIENLIDHHNLHTKPYRNFSLQHGMGKRRPGGKRYDDHI